MVMNRFLRVLNILLASLVLILTLILSFAGKAHALEPAQLEPRPIESPEIKVVGEIGKVGHICDKANPIIINSLQDPPGKLRDILERYNDYTHLWENYGIGSLLNKGVDEVAYCIVFEHLNNVPLTVRQQKMVFEKKDDRDVYDVYIIGLKLKSEIIEGPLFEVIHKGGPGKIILKDIELTDVRDGLFLDARESIRAGTLIPKDAIQVFNSQVTGANKEGNCLIVKARGTVLDNVTATKCVEGIRVEADSVTIKNSHIYDNMVGVLVAEGRSGMDIERSLIYGNNDGNDNTPRRFDGIRIEPDIFFYDLNFFDVVNGEPIPIDPKEDLIVYEDRTVYILLPIDQTSDSKIEFLKTDEGDCAIGISSYGQACGLLEDMPLALKAEDLNQNRIIKYQLSAEYLNKPLVAVFTSPASGSTAISQSFLVPGEIAFVQTPYDIPTPGSGATDEIAAAGPEEEIEEPSGEGMGGDEALILDSTEMGGGLGIGPPAAKCSLTSGESFRTVCVGFDLWWLIFSIALIGTLRTVLIRINNRRR